MKPLYFIPVLLFIVLGACKKEPSIAVATPDTPNIVLDTLAYRCETIPPPPTVFGYKDTTTDENQNINTFMYNPANPNEIVIVVNGYPVNPNKMYCFNIVQNKLTFLDNLGDFIPSINKKGWVVYSTIDNNIFKIKCNGDSLKQLTSSNNASDPHWDYSENNFYYFQAATGSYKAQIIKAEANGNGINSIPAEMPYMAVFKNSDKLVYQKTNNNTVFLTIHDVLTSKETNLISGPFDPKSGKLYFDNLCLDNTDEHIYWSNSSGIFKCNISSLKVDTVFKNCDNVKYNSPVFQTARPYELLFTVHLIKPLLPFKLLHQYRAVQKNLLTKELTELHVFP